MTIDELQAAYPNHPLVETVRSVGFWINNEDWMRVKDYRPDGDPTDQSFGVFLEVVDQDGEEVDELLVQCAPDMVINGHSHEMMRVNSMPMARVAKLAIGIITG